MTTIPLMVFISASSFSLVTLAFNQNYPLLPDIIRFLALLGAIQAVTSPVGILYYLKEKTKLMFLTNIAALAALGISVLIACYTYNIIFVIIIYTLIYLVFVIPISNIIIYKHYDLKLRKLFFTCIPYVVSSYFTILSIEYIFSLLSLSWSPLLSVLGKFSFFVLAYGLSLALINRWMPGRRFYHQYLVKIKLAA